MWLQLILYETLIGVAQPRPHPTRKARSDVSVNRIGQMPVFVLRSLAGINLSNSGDMHCWGIFTLYRVR